MLQAWDEWAEGEDHDCQNDRPDYFPSSQLYLVFVFAEGGYDLEHYKFADWSQVRSNMRLFFTC